jgi:hypothetical protein
MVTAGFKWSSTNTNVDYQNLITVFLNGYGGIKHIYNSNGIPVQYNVDSQGNPLGTQIAIACNDDKGSCSCYPECISPNTCDVTRLRCKPPNGCENPSPCGDRVNKWLCPPSIACYSEDDAKRICIQDACLSW